MSEKLKYPTKAVGEKHEKAPSQADRLLDYTFIGSLEKEPLSVNFWHVEKPIKSHK